MRLGDMSVMPSQGGGDDGTLRGPWKWLGDCCSRPSGSSMNALKPLKREVGKAQLAFSYRCAYRRLE